MKTPSSPVIGVKIPTKEQVLENPRRGDFVGGGWIDSTNPCSINLYWHRRREHFTIYSLLQILEHETLHVVLATLFNLETSMKLDNINRSACFWLTEKKLIFANEYRIIDWVLPPYLEEPTEDLL